MTMSDVMDDRESPAQPLQQVTEGAERGIRLTEQQQRARRARSIAIALALGAFVVVIFLVTIVKLGSNVLTRPM